MRAVLTCLCVILAGCADETEDTGGGSTSSSSTGESEAGTTVGTSGTSGDGTEVGSGTDDSGTTGGFVEIDCAPVCADVVSDAGIAVCYACRCKNAMDGFLPSVEQLQCSQAEELTIYTADISGPVPSLVPVTGEVDTCVNPSLLYETCQTGSRLGQLQEGNVYVKWICRDPPTGGDTYFDVGVILHNTRNGASCWFDDVNMVTGSDDLPDLDLMEAGEGNLTNFLEKFYFTDGDSCTTDCHDADPFVYTPYFRGMWSTGTFVKGRYNRVALDGSLSAVNSSHLVSPEITVCATCHRLGSAAGCDFLSPDALGEFKTPAHEQAVVDATDVTSPNWSLAYWMPDGAPVETLEDWSSMFGAAKSHILECCANPGVDSANCDWEPIPSGL